ncbi:MAG: phage baseplate assembly protein V [Treponema sp.]|jgi:phage baseplate assembly protein gpV/uncharacterized Zn-binding protein involved in type VI secretion|nr:phage baseplate assembly protein V [Treponema sp.]
MIFNLNEEIDRLRREHPEVRAGRDWTPHYLEMQETDRGFPRYGTVVDNKDPKCMGRIRVAADTIAPGVITPWIPVIALGATKNTGWWQLPDIGTQVLMAFVGKGHSRPVVLGCIYDRKHLPPKHSTEKKSDSKLYQTKAHRMEFIDEEGKESIILSSAKGQMRVVLSKDKGIEIVNELGDIKINCRKLKIEGGKGINIEGKKSVSIHSDDKAGIKAKSGIQIECGKEVKLKGNNIKLEASKGITTEGKQLAAEGDKVTGFDVHQMVVPSGNGTAVVPLPHPFLGKLADKLSKDVKIKGHNAAVKGSVAKHDDPVHNQLPGTIKFQQNPKKEGEVTGGTGSKVKINGKEAAVIGSTVTTCNDIGARENSVIIAPGMSMPMPVIINPKNTEEYNLQREKEQTKSPEFTNAKWVKTSVKEGEKAELSAQVKDIADGNMVTFQVWKEGQNPAASIAQGQTTATVEGGTAKGEWAYTPPRSEEIPPDNDPKYFFTAHSAWCPMKQSGNMTVELKRPEIKEAKWLDSDEAETDKGLVGDALKLSVSCNADTAEGAGVTFKVYDEGADPKRDKPVYEAGGKNVNGKAEAEWEYHYEHDPENPLKEKPKYFFTVNSPRCKEVKSGTVEISAMIDVVVQDEITQEIIKDAPCELFRDGETFQEVTTDDDGKITLEDLVPGNYSIMPKRKEEEDDGE